ncbi:MAG: hypothetical protein IPG56_13025 [Caulobacteraceae bacterium]|nr:hypothetical protein [Caulobacteraceae bacterium]
MWSGSHTFNVIPPVRIGDDISAVFHHESDAWHAGAPIERAFAFQHLPNDREGIGEKRRRDLDALASASLLVAPSRFDAAARLIARPGLTPGEIWIT